MFGAANRPSIDEEMHPAPNLPRHKTQVIVQDATGQFIPSFIHQRREAQMEQQRGMLDAAFDAGSLWDVSDDAKDYEQVVASVVRFLTGCAEHLGAFCAGMSFFFVMVVYFSAATSEQGRFLELYSHFYKYCQLTFYILTVVLVVLMVLPFAADISFYDLKRRPFALRTAVNAKLAEEGQQQQEQQEHQKQVEFETMVQGGTGSPFRHLVNFRLVCYLVALAAAFVADSVQQDRSEEEIRSLSYSLTTRLHVAMVMRAAAFCLAWLIAFASVGNQRR